MKAIRSAIFVLVAVIVMSFITTGCASYKGLIPDKNVTMKNVTINSPWTGLPIFKADELTTTLGPLPPPSTPSVSETTK